MQNNLRKVPNHILARQQIEALQRLASEDYCAPCEDMTPPPVTDTPAVVVPPVDTPPPESTSDRDEAFYQQLFWSKADMLFPKAPKPFA